MLKIRTDPTLLKIRTDPECTTRVKPTRKDIFPVFVQSRSRGHFFGTPFAPFISVRLRQTPASPCAAHFHCHHSIGYSQDLSRDLCISTNAAMRNPSLAAMETDCTEELLAQSVKDGHYLCECVRAISPPAEGVMSQGGWWKGGFGGE